jgi:hypothetical protein
MRSVKKRKQIKEIMHGSKEFKKRKGN